MEITLFQGLGLAVLALILGLDFWLEAFFVFRPIIVCTLAGLILGDLQLGLVVGGVTELAFAGLTPAGGTQPPNPIMAGIMGVVIAYITPGYTAGAVSATAAGEAMALALPFSFVMQYIILFCYSSFSLFMKGADRAAEEADVNGIVRINMMCTLIIAVIYAVVTFLCAYAAQGAIQALYDQMPAWLTNGFAVAGGILPAVGFAMLMKVMLKKEYLPYLLIGFVMSCFLVFSNMLPIAIVGTALALIIYNLDKEKAAILAKVGGAKNSAKGDDDDGI